MKTYQVLAKRWERGWELHIDGVGVTQSKTLARAEQDVADYLDMLVGEEARTIVVTPDLGSEIDDRIRRAREALTQAVEMQRVAAERSREIVRTLAGKGLPGAEIAAVLKVSPQRVSQLAAQAGRSRATAATQAAAVAKGRAVAAKRPKPVAAKRTAKRVGAGVKIAATSGAKKKASAAKAARRG